ncbi:MAG TPA: hypothetical protein VN224_09710, partial [Xanthomonadales bacterium]|nr:hypothetical protein [Xanthomonadales bacterium]
ARIRNGTPGPTHALRGLTRRPRDLDDGRRLRDRIRGKPVRSGTQPLDRGPSLHGNVTNTRLTPRIIDRLDAAYVRLRLSLRAETDPSLPDAGPDKPLLLHCTVGSEEIRAFVRQCPVCANWLSAKTNGHGASTA